MNEWKGIETAPKDRKILLTDGEFVGFGEWKVLSTEEWQDVDATTRKLVQKERGLFVFDWESEAYRMPTLWADFPVPKGYGIL